MLMHFWSADGLRGREERVKIEEAKKTSMGGGRAPSTTHSVDYCAAGEITDNSSMERDVDDLLTGINKPSGCTDGDNSALKDKDLELDEGNGTKYDNLDAMGRSPCSISFDDSIRQRRRGRGYQEIMTSYLSLELRKGTLKEAKSKIMSYTPGTWIEEVGGLRKSDYKLPKATTLLLIGPRGSGKSSLVNRILRVFEDDKFASVRAQVSYNSSVDDGTYFLQEYMIPRGSTSFCIYDTRSLSDNLSDNYEMLESWITKGVRHGELVIRDSDSPSIRKTMKCKDRQIGCCSRETRMVNMVIYVVNGVSILESMDDNNDDMQNSYVLAKTFRCPYLSFKAPRSIYTTAKRLSCDNIICIIIKGTIIKISVAELVGRSGIIVADSVDSDDKPVVVFTHGDLLTRSERARVRIYLGDLLGIPPDKQVFDIPDKSDAATELTILDMLQYSLEHADRNLPCKNSTLEKVVAVFQLVCLVGFFLIALYVAHRLWKLMGRDMRRNSEPEAHLDWHAIRHLWLA